MKRICMLISCILVATLLLAACAAPQSSQSSLDESSHALIVSQGQESSSGLTGNGVTTDTQPNTVNQVDNERLRIYAQDFARYFREPLSNISEIANDPRVWSFSINTLYSILSQNGQLPENVAENDWDEQYYMSNTMMLELSSLLINVNRFPDEMYSPENIHYPYSADLDAFLYRPFAPPDFLTEIIESSQNGQTYSFAISVQNVEGIEIRKNVYSFIEIATEKYGTQYQIASIAPA